MKVLEIKNNLVKIAYDVKDNLALSNFVIIEDTNTPYVAQVVNIKADSTTNFAIVKLLFTFNEEGILKNYNGTIPSTKANVSILPSNELLDIIPIEDPIRMGQLAQQNVELKVDKTIFDNNLLIQFPNNLEGNFKKNKPITIKMSGISDNYILWVLEDLKPVSSYHIELPKNKSAVLSYKPGNKTKNVKAIAIPLSSNLPEESTSLVVK